MTQQQRDNVSKWHLWKIPRNKGTKWLYSDEYRKKIWAKSKGRQHTEESKKKISDKLIWRTVTHETRKKIQMAQIWEKWNNRQWWISKRKYPYERTETLKRSIRERDNYVCRMCWIQQCDRVHAIHHIDYNKYNCNPNNLITLCSICHWKTSINRRYRIDYFKNIMGNK